MDSVFGSVAFASLEIGDSAEQSTACAGNGQGNGKLVDCRLDNGVGKVTIRVERESPVVVRLARLTFLVPLVTSSPTMA